MKTNKLIVASAIVISVLAACQKGDRTSPPLCNLNASMPEELGDKRLLPQKNIEITTDQVLKLIKDFKSGISSQNNQISQGKLIEADSVHFDSSIFVVEAALNYDFDYNIADTAFNVLPPDTSEFTIPITRANQKVNSDDLEGAYLQLHQYIENSISGRTKVKVVDLDAYISGNQVYYRAKVIKNYYWMTLKDCTPFQQGEKPDEICFPNSATSVIAYKLLNCKFLPCPSGWYFNVSSTYDSNISNSGTYSGILYYNSPIYYNAGGFCDNTVLSTSQLNSYVNNIENYINSIKPTGKSVASIDLHSFKSPNAPINYYYFSVYWYMTVTYGQSSYQGC